MRTSLKLWSAASLKVFVLLSAGIAHVNPLAVSPVLASLLAVESSAVIALVCLVRVGLGPTGAAQVGRPV